MSNRPQYERFRRSNHHHLKLVQIEKRAKIFPKGAPQKAVVMDRKDVRAKRIMAFAWTFLIGILLGRIL